MPKKRTLKKARIVAARSGSSLSLQDLEPITSLDTIYLIDASSNPVKLEIKLGEAEQTGRINVKLENNFIAEGHSGNLPETSLGTNRSLNGKKLTITAIITDTSRETNVTSLTLAISGGIVSNQFSLLKKVNEEGESADYMCLIEFFKP
jgi:hypothetical protein